jgi:ABC-2 type transport system permease protein
MRRTLRALPTLLRVGLAEMVAYRSELLIWILSATGPIIMLLVWDRAAAGGPIRGFDQAAFARYFTAGLVVRQLTSAWIVWDLNESIRTGTLSPSLLKPLHPLLFRACENLVALPFRVVVLMPLVFAMWLWRPEVGLSIGGTEIALWVVSMALAWATNFLAQVAFGSLAFFLDQSLGIFNVWFALWALLSGYLFPLELVPEGLRTIVLLLPFRGMLAVPTEIAAGQLSGIAALEAIGLQAAWVIAFALLARFSWRAGVRRYGAFGA